ncbi:MAG: hypothetical protein AAGG59_13055 [Bacteroidota bacterium]
MIILIGILSGLLVALLLLIKMLPDKVQYIETVTIERPVRNVYDAIRYQEQLMEWSAWPKETKSDCAVENTDGQIGAQTVYLNKKGKKFGYQEITNLIENEQVDFYLKSFVAPFEKDVRLKFILREYPENETLVIMWFDEALRKPHFLIAYFGGILKWVHSMHLKDLAYLKQYVETR